MKNNITHRTKTRTRKNKCLISEAFLKRALILTECVDKKYRKNCLKFL